MIVNCFSCQGHGFQGTQDCWTCGGTGKLNTERMCHCGRAAILTVNGHFTCASLECRLENVKQETTIIPVEDIQLDPAYRFVN